MIDELVIYVHPDGTPTGETAPKLDAHTNKTRQHLAFSCYVFDEQGKFLVTQRAFSKKVWPGVWTNTVCGHPGVGEDMTDAIMRRLDFELGMSASDFTLVLPKYTYVTPPFNGIIENEFCPVYFARATSQPKPNPGEVENYKWMDWNEFVATVQDDKADVWSWWTKDQLRQLKNNPVLATYKEAK